MYEVVKRDGKVTEFEDSAQSLEDVLVEVTAEEPAAEG